MNSLEFWSGVIIVVVTQFSAVFIVLKQLKGQAPLTNAQAQSAISDAWEGVGQEYARLLGHYKALEEEVAVLRPLTLKLAMQEQAIHQTEEDKADWKRYAEKLSHQLEEHNVTPIPFRRLPSNGDSEKMKAVTREQIDSVMK